MPIAARHLGSVAYAMLDLRRLRLLRELHERGTIAAVAEALRFTPSAVSQQLAVLEREAGVPLLERAGRGVRLTDPALVLVGHAEALLERAARGRGRAGRRRRHASPAGRGSRRSSPSRCGSRSRPCGGSRATRPGCAASSSRPSPSSRCPRSRSATSTSCWPTSGSTSRCARPPGVERQDLRRDPMLLILPAAHPAARGHRGAVAARRARRRRVGHRPAGHGVGGDHARARAACSAASTPTSATARTTR